LVGLSFLDITSQVNFLADTHPNRFFNFFKSGGSTWFGQQIISATNLSTSAEEGWAAIRLM
jgi:hypothetical protein